MSYAINWLRRVLGIASPSKVYGAQGERLGNRWLIDLGHGPVAPRTLNQLNEAELRAYIRIIESSEEWGCFFELGHDGASVLI